jgi:signal transduction histidine kinase
MDILNVTAGLVERLSGAASSRWVKLWQTAVLVSIATIAAYIGDYLLTIVILHHDDLYTPDTTIIISVIVAIPLAYYMVSQRYNLIAAKEALAAAKIAAEEAARARAEFTVAITHEIRTSLNGVVGMARAMDAGALSADQQAQLAVISRSGEALIKLIADLEPPHDGKRST